MASYATQSDIFWLNATNVILGLVVLLCAAAIAGAIVGELLARRRKRAGYMAEITRDFDTHAFLDPDLGLTMADGGEPLDKPGSGPAEPDQKR